MSKLCKYNIVFGTDIGYIQHLAVALASLLKNNSGMNVYVINTSIPEKDWKKLQKLFVGKDSNLIDSKIDNQDIQGLIINSYFTHANYYRLFIPDIIKDHKALYLDADVVIVNRIDELYNIELSNTCLAAVANPGIYKNPDLGMDASAQYFNSGVLLMNLEYWRSRNIKNKIIEFTKVKPDVIQFADQDGLNSVINGNWLELHPRYNLHTVLLHNDWNTDSTIIEAIDNPVIIHYTGSSKPWHLGDTHPYKHLYWKYLKMTPYKYSLPSKPLSFFSLNNLRRMIPKPIKERIKKIIKWEV